MLLKLGILGIYIVLCLSCSGCSTTPVKIINFSETEYYEEEKDGTVYHCMSDYYVQKILNAKIDKIDPDK